MPGVRWIVLGSGGGEAAPDRVSPGHLLETPEAAVLFDCGDGVTGSFLRLGRRVEDVDAICISHTHPDHVGGLSFFLQLMYLAVRRRELHVYLPAEAIDGIKSYLELSYLFVERFPFPVACIPLEDGVHITCADISVIPHANTHLTRHRGQPWMDGVGNRGGCFSFEIGCRSKKVVYSADVGALDDLAFCTGANLLIAETTHVSVAELLPRAEIWQIATLALVHLGPDFDPESVTAARRFFTGQILIAADGLCIPLND